MLTKFKNSFTHSLKVAHSTLLRSIDKINAKIISEDDKERLISFYRDDERSKRSVEQKREDCVRLKELILLSEDFVAPIEGIAGLKGEAKTDRSATGMMM